MSRDTIYHTQNANEYEQAYDLAQSMFNYEQYKRFPDYRIETGVDKTSGLNWEIMVSELETEDATHVEQPQLAQISVTLSEDANKGRVIVKFQSIIAYGHKS